jgi:hypothetical protein
VSIRQHSFLLEAAETGPTSATYHLSQQEAADIGMAGMEISSLARQLIFAIGFFDIKYTGARALQIWAMCVTAEEGLLLQQICDPIDGSTAYQRLGIFHVGHMPFFYPRGSVEQGYPLEYSVNADRLPVSTVVLV